MSVIDYFASKGAIRVVQVHTHPNTYGSDHHPVICLVYGGLGLDHRHQQRWTWSYFVATWNVERDRPHKQVIAGLEALFSQGIDVVLAQECDGYFAAFRDHFGDRVAQLDTRPGQAEAAVIAAPDVELTGHESLRLALSGWWTVRGGWHPPQALATALVDGRLRVASGHMPVSIRWHKVAGKVVPFGPPLRLLAWWQASRRLPRFCNRPRRHALLVGQDWNAVPGQGGAASPLAIANAAGLRLHVPTTSTHGR